MSKSKARFKKAVEALAKKGNTAPTLVEIGKAMSPPVSRQRVFVIYNELLSAGLIEYKKARMLVK